MNDKKPKFLMVIKRINPVDKLAKDNEGNYYLIARHTDNKIEAIPISPEKAQEYMEQL